MKPARIAGAVTAFAAASLPVLLPSAALADPAGDLRKDISLVRSFCSPFTQKVTGLNGETVQEGSGSVCVSKEKSSFRVETKTPDENLVVSDGKSVWSYDPFMQSRSPSPRFPKLQELAAGAHCLRLPGGLEEVQRKACERRL